MSQQKPKSDEKATESKADRFRKSLDDSEEKSENAHRESQRLAKSISGVRDIHKTLKKRFDELEKSSKTEIERMKKKYTKIRTQVDKHRFALVLIDGDGTNFRENFVQQGTNGGLQAATNLIQELRQNLNLKAEIILVRIYANIGINNNGLERQYARLQSVDRKNLLKFVVGFNSHKYCDFTESGAERGHAYQKVAETFELYSRDLHCEHIIFAGSHNRSYAPLLSQYREPARRREGLQITLLRGQPFVEELEALANDFGGPLELPSLFRSRSLD